MNISFRIAFLSVSFGLFLSSCKRSETLFTLVDAKQSGVQFANTIIENDSINVLDFENVYNGGGVGIADFNNDGLVDIYFTGNLVPNKLYLNKGNFKFEDITAAAGVEGKGRWSRGVAVIDINNDGWMDIYVCATLKKNPAERENMLYINQGEDNNGVPSFIDMAAAYGLNDNSQSTQAAFFDYDNDGDLDMYLANNEIVKDDYPNRFRPILKDGSHANTDKLFRNDWDPVKQHPVFTNVSKEAGIMVEGYAHAVTIADINNDGWKDIYVTNDYLSNDLLWINNGNGTFTDRLSDYFKHTSANAMGNDIVDLNSDGLADVVVLDMNPEDNYRKKMMLNPNSYQTYQNSDQFGYSYQYVRNTLQVNQGPRVLGNDTVGAPVFSEMAFFAGIAETDWSWTPVVADFDNDGNRDIIITNGFPRDVTDHDFVTFRGSAYAVATKKQLLEQIPEVKIHNYAFRNNGQLHFSNVTNDWGLTMPSFSNGAVYADLDNDGDLDLVVNNINDPASLYRNNTNKGKTEQHHYLNIRLQGDSLNRNGLGASVMAYYAGKKEVWENTPYRGYLSSVDNRIHFGLGTQQAVDSLVVLWPDGKKQVMANVKADTLLTLNYWKADQFYAIHPPVQWATQSLLRDITASAGIQYVQQEKDFVDFNIQKLLPHKFSEYGPALAAGDLNGDGLDDMVIGGSFSFSPTLLLQNANGKFTSKAILPEADINNKRWEDVGILLFDADGDGDLDLYTASGGFENEHNTAAYQDHLYLNDGKAGFTPLTGAIPANTVSKSCVRAVDYDRDGDLDLFVAGRVDPWNYPKPVSSFIYRNDSKNGRIQFTDVTALVAKSLNNAGLVCDAVFTDVDNDGWVDLLLAGEWMPMTLLKNQSGKFEPVSTGLEQQLGWWNTIAPGDFDNDGDMDYVVGNLGRNSFYRGNEQHPVEMIAADFDKNGSFDAFPFLYLPDESGQLKLFPAQTRDDIVKQMISMRTKFQNYKTYARAGKSDMFSPEQLKDAMELKANQFNSVLLLNDGKGRFSMQPLPDAAQVSVLNGMVVEDLNRDGNLDILINGNDYGTEVSVGRYDALNGLLLLGKGDGHFEPATILESGFYMPGNGKSLVSLSSAGGQWLVAASANRGPLKLFALKQAIQSIPAAPGLYAVEYSLPNGKKQKRELYYGNSFLSQSARRYLIPAKATAASGVNSKGEKISIPF